MVSQPKDLHIWFIEMHTWWQAQHYQVNIHGLSSLQQLCELNSLTCQFYKWRHRLKRLSNLPKLTQSLSDSSGIQTKSSDWKDECFSLHCHNLRKTFWVLHSTGEWWIVFLMPGALRFRWDVLQSGLHKEKGNQGSASYSVIFIYKVLGCICFLERRPYLGR